MIVNKTNKKLVIFGAAEQAEVASFFFDHDSDFEVVAFTVDSEYIKTGSFRERPVVAFEEVELRYPPEQFEMFVALGYSKVNKVRTRICQLAKEKGYRLAKYVSSKATLWPDFNCGENCFILEGNNIQPFVKIGNNVTLWSGNHIGHHSVIENNVFISSHVVVSGGCTVKENTFIGVNAALRDHIVVERENVIGASTLLTGSTDPFGVYKGVPGKLGLKRSFELNGI